MNRLALARMATRKIYQTIEQTKADTVVEQNDSIVISNVEEEKVIPNVEEEKVIPNVEEEKVIPNVEEEKVLVMPETDCQSGSKNIDHSINDVILDEQFTHEIVYLTLDTQSIPNELPDPKESTDVEIQLKPVKSKERKKQKK